MTTTVAYSGFDVVQLAVAVGALTWLLYQEVRFPGDVRRWPVTALVAGWSVAYPFGLAANAGTGFLGVDAMTARYLQHALLLVAAFCLVCFFQFSALEPLLAARRALREAAGLLVALVLVTSANLAIPEELRVPAATALTGPAEGPVGVPAIAVFYAAANGYLVYVSLATGVWTRRYARGAEPRLRLGLRVASAGLASISLAGTVFVLSSVSLLVGAPAPAPVTAVGLFLAMAGILVFLAGMGYPYLVTRAALSKVWLRHRRAYRQLHPLWTILNERFPQDALNREPVSMLRDALTLRGVHRRYYRWVIECRDGLVRISPYLASLGSTGTDLAVPEHLARRLTDALRAHAAGETVPPQAIPVAVPRDHGLAADAARLIEVANAVRRVAPA